MFKIIVVGVEGGAGVVRRVDVDALDGLAIARQQRRKDGQIVAVHDEIIGVAAT